MGFDPLRATRFAPHSSGGAEALHHAVEFHDSQLVACERWPDRVILRLRAYVHESEGRPGLDAGTGWLQRCALVLEEAQLSGPTESAETIADGRVEVDGVAVEGVIALPFTAEGELSLQLELAEGTLRATARRLRLEPVGPAQFVENVPPLR